MSSQLFWIKFPQTAMTTFCIKSAIIFNLQHCTVQYVSFWLIVYCASTSYTFTLFSHVSNTFNLVHFSFPTIFEKKIRSEQIEVVWQKHLQWRKLQFFIPEHLSIIKPICVIDVMFSKQVAKPRMRSGFFLFTRVHQVPRWSWPNSWRWRGGGGC